MDQERALASLYIQSCLTVLLGVYVLWKRPRGPAAQGRRWWVRPLNQRRVDFGYFETVFPEMRNNDPEVFEEVFRMNSKRFNILCNYLRNALQKTSHRTPLSVEERVAITLRHLAHGTSVHELARSFLRGVSTVALTVREVCEEIVKVVGKTHLRTPATQEEWLTIADGFWTNWQMPHCLGSIDGKHIFCQAPDNTGTLCWNYKHSYSRVLLAVCDSRYRFLFIHTGANGSSSDGGIFDKCPFGQQIVNDRLPTPPPTYLPNTNVMSPFFFVGDNAFPLLPNLMRPYPGRDIPDEETIYNYRLSRARRVIENSFGIMSAKFRILRTTIQASDRTLDAIVGACCTLHNFLIDCDEAEGNKRYCPIGNRRVGADDEDQHGWRQFARALRDLDPQDEGHEASDLAFQTRNNLKNYFLSHVGAVPWQYDRAFRVE